MATSFEAGSWVWFADEDACYLPGKVSAAFNRGEAATIECEDGTTRSLTGKETETVEECDPDALGNCENMVKLNNLNEPTILHNLRNRYLKNDIYTYVGTILIAVNPFKLLPLYTPQVQDIYKEKGSRDTPPHVYAIADNAYNNLLADRVHQSIVISGESGAGKTETMKLVLQYLAEVSGRAQKRTSGDSSESLEQQILKSNPVMEAFGNAKTVRNNNSSRFGKWTEINFSSTGAIIGGSIINYLLEKSRIPFQAEGERNYHIFYQLIAGGEVYPELKAKLKLKEADDYHYLNQSGVTTVENINDEKDYEQLMDAMAVLNMTKDEQDNILQLVSAILHLGNVEFEPDPSATEDDGAKVKTADLLALAAEQLGVDGAALDKSLCYKNIGAREDIFVNYSLAGAADARDGLSKALYGKLFDWLIQKINAALLANVGGGAGAGASKKDKITNIGVLDIFGFECFTTNSFEQLCINFCNEKLQFHFNEHIFKLEQEEYASEGITVEHIEFSDNQACLDLLELKSTGLFSMIDEEINIPRGSDEGFLSKAITKHSSHVNFSKPSPRDKDARQVFIVHHYAGKVPYNVTSFLEKNKDALHQDIRACMTSSSNPLIASLLPAPAAKTGGRGSAKAKQLTLGTQFKNQLVSLMATLNATEPHFIRCMKPNDEKRGDLFQSNMMLAQLRYAGLLEVCRIRQIGYPVRKAFGEFVFRYRCLALTAAKDHTTLLAALSESGLAREGQWQIGHTKVFMRNLQQSQFEEAREAALKEVVTKMQAQARRFILRCRYLNYVKILAQVKAAIASRNLETLDTALTEVQELPNIGGKGAGLHLKVVQEAMTLKERLELELRVTGLLEDGIKERDFPALQSAVKMADEMSFETPLVAKAKELMARIQEEKKVIADLKAAVEARDKAKLIELIAKAEGLELQDSEMYKQATALKARMEEEDNARDALRKAIDGKQLEALTEAIAKIVAMGLGDDPLCKEAQTMKEHLERQDEARSALREATSARVLLDLTAALAQAAKAELPADDEAMVAATTLKARLDKEQEMEAELNTVGDNGDAATIEAALGRAAALEMTDSPGLTKAKQRLTLLQEEAACTQQLIDAVKENKVSPLSAAVNKANEMGLTDIPEYAKAEKALKKFAAQNKVLESLNDATKAGDIEALGKAIAECEGKKLGDNEQVVAARELMVKLEAEKALAETLSKAASAYDEKSLPDLFAEATAKNLGKRHAAAFAAAQAAVETLTAEKTHAEAIRAAIKAKDADQLNEVTAKAREAGDAKGATLQAALTDSEAAVAKFAKQAEITAALTTELEAEESDKEKLRTLLEEAKKVDLDNAKSRQAEAIVDRERIVAETKKALNDACTNNDLDALNDAMGRAIELGIEGEDIEAAKAVRSRLDEEKEMAGALMATMKMINTKLEGRQALEPSEVAPLEAAIEEASGNGLPDDSPTMKEGKALKTRLENMLVLQGEMQEALDADAPAIKDVRKLLQRADDLEMPAKNPVLSATRKLYKKLEQARAAAAMADEYDDDEDIPTLDDEEQARLREEKMRKAAQPKYHWTKFPNIRDADAFAKGVLLNKKKVKQNQLRWQPSVIPRSIYDFGADKELSKLATRIHKALLGYSGDKSMSFPATLAQDILQKGLEIPDLVDEIYLQICKHLTHNPRPESAQRGWQVLCMAVGTFPPSHDFEHYLLNFILGFREGSGAIGNYARYSLRRLEGILNSGPSGFVPSVDEIQAYKERPPILATIELVDGTPLTEDLPITPDLNVSKVLDICTHFMELQDPRMSYFGIFVEDVNAAEGDEAVLNPLGGSADSDTAKVEALKKTPRPLQSENFMGDVVTVKVRQGQAFKFVFKRKIYLRHMDEPSDDAMYERLVYLQACDEVIIGNIPISTKEEVAKLVAQAIAIDLGDEIPTDADELVEADLEEYIPIPWRKKMPMEDWAKLVLTHRDDVLSEDAEDLQTSFVEEIRSHPLYGTLVFHVRKHTFPEAMKSFPEFLIVGFNSEGLHFLNEERETLASFGYADIYRWGGSSSQFSIIIWNAETQDTDDVSMFTSQAADMASLILDYITAIMATTEN